jgi:predicted dithiol-disulfide oxidoreductase (DUF899 family)
VIAPETIAGSPQAGSCTASLADLFRGRSQLLVYHFMFGPEYTGGCPASSAIADAFNGFAVHLEHHDVAMIVVSRAPIAALQAYKRRMGWTFTWVSSLNSDFNYDFNASFTDEQQNSGRIDYNHRTIGAISDSAKILDSAPREFAAMTGTYTREAPGMSAFAFSDGVVYHTYSTYARPRRAVGDVPVARPGAEGA